MKVVIKHLCSVAVVAMTLTGCGAPQDGGGNAAETSSYPSLASKWANTTINVCWEAPTNAFPTEKQWVQSHVTSEYASKTNIHFVGWGSCKSGQAGVHVTVSDVPGANPHTSSLGKYLNGMTNGMELNFTFKNWSQACKTQRQGCIQAIAAHEFGHAIGLAHEQNRPDTPSTCSSPKQGSMGDTMVGRWDVSSIMNYCNPVYNNAGRLSPGDVAGVARLYGTRTGG